MVTLAGIGAILLISITLWDAFGTIILPRRVSGRFRFTTIIYQSTWKPMRWIVRMLPQRYRESWLAVYGPLSLIILLLAWVASLIIGFALLQLAFGSQVASSHGKGGFGTLLYLSGTTFFTLGLGDIVPLSAPARFLTVLEAGTGFGILAIVIGYFPVLYQAFSRREVIISLLDARAGSPPTAIELLCRHCKDDEQGMISFLRDWERWSAELLESHLSYPSLAFFRSQHENQSWLGALTVILDTCALIISGIENLPKPTARLTFAIARHAAVDLCQILNATPIYQDNRLSSSEFEQICTTLAEYGIVMYKDHTLVEKRLSEQRHLYEPYINALAKQLLLPLPNWTPDPDAQDDWERTSWESGTNL
jgi:hypothetical protein